MHLYVMLRQQIFCIFARNPLRLQDAQAVEALRQKLRISPTILVHSDELQDGIVAAENGTRGSDLRSYVMFVRSSLLRFQKCFISILPKEEDMPFDSQNSTGWLNRPLWHVFSSYLFLWFA